MSEPRKKRKPRIKIPESPLKNWREKLHPFYVRMVEYNNRVSELLASANEADRKEGERLADNPPREFVEEAERLHDAIPPSERPRHDAHVSIFGAVDSKEGSVMSEGQFMAGWLAWNKFGKSIIELVEGDKAGDEKSSRQLASVTKDYQDWRYGKLDPNKMRFKFDSHHVLLIQAGLDLGIESLSAEELADCFDALCNCGKHHDPDNLRTLRTRVIKTIQRLTRKPGETMRQ